jgi:hypothetical protein
VKPTTTALAVSLLTLTFLGSRPVDASAQDRGKPAARDAITVVACVVREADYTRPAAVAGSPELQLLLANAQTGTPTHSVTGLREQELAQHVGQRVEISGTVEQPRTTPITGTADGSRRGVVNTEAPGATGITPEGAAAHEPSDALSSTVQAGQVADPQRGVSDPAYRVATLPRLNATSFRRVSGSCASVDSRRESGARAAAATATSRQVSAPPPLSQPALTSRPSETVTVRGCLVRRTAGGTALTPATDRLDPLALMDASIAGPTAAAGGAPGATAAADRGTGTLPAPVATSGGTPQDAGRMALALTMAAEHQRELSRLVGERVEITGTLGETAPERATAGSTPVGEPGAAGRIEQRPDDAHTSAPTRTVRVATFRALGGSCN